MDKQSRDERFFVLLHRKIMQKKGSAKRRAKKYYIDQYRRTGVIPRPLLLAEQGIMEGRKCSGRKRALDGQVKKRFVDMVKASSDPDDPGFMFITQRARTLKNYHRFLEDEFGKKISYEALRRMIKEEDLRIYLEKPDFDQERSAHAFKNPAVFDLVQVDGCVLQYLKIRNETGTWQKPCVIETYDTGSRNMFDLDAFFSENSLNAVKIFNRFLLSTPFPQKTIGFRPDRAGGFMNLRRPITALNMAYSVPGGFELKADFSRPKTPKDKAHLESSHRSLHNFEIRIIKAFEKRIAKADPGWIFKNGKRVRITVTCLDIGLQELRESGMLEAYRREHNDSKHIFSVDGRTLSWIPSKMLEEYLKTVRTISFAPERIEEFIKYGYDKKNATVSADGRITFGKRRYVVVEGAGKFARTRSTKVQVSRVDGKLLLFENRKDGVFLGEAVCLKPFEKPTGTPPSEVKSNEVEQLCVFLEESGMVVDRGRLVEMYREGLSLAAARTIYRNNRERYDKFLSRLRQPPPIRGTALFNAFVLDCARHRNRTGYGEKRHETKRELHQ